MLNVKINFRLKLNTTEVEKLFYHYDASCGGISVRSTYASVIRIVWHFVTPCLCHVKPLCMPDVGFQPDVPSFATSVLHQ